MELGGKLGQADAGSIADPVFGGGADGPLITVGSVGGSGVAVGLLGNVEIRLSTDAHLLNLVERFGRLLAVTDAVDERVRLDGDDVNITGHDRVFGGFSNPDRIPDRYGGSERQTSCQDQFSEPSHASDSFRYGRGGIEPRLKHVLPYIVKGERRQGYHREKWAEILGGAIVFGKPGHCRLPIAGPNLQCAPGVHSAAGPQPSIQLRH